MYYQKYISQTNVHLTSQEVGINLAQILEGVPQEIVKLQGCNDNSRGGSPAKWFQQ